MKISRRKLLLGVGAAGVLGGAAVVPMINREGRLNRLNHAYPLLLVQKAITRVCGCSHHRCWPSRDHDRN